MSSFCLSSAKVVPAALCGVQGSRACKEQITRCAWGTSLPCWVMPGVRSKLFLPYPSRMHLSLWYGAHGLCSGSESARRCSSPHPELFRGSAHVLGTYPSFSWHFWKKCTKNDVCWLSFQAKVAQQWAEEAPCLLFSPLGAAAIHQVGQQTAQRSLDTLLIRVHLPLHRSSGSHLVLC